jgi:hypothetical protein
MAQIKYSVDPNEESIVICNFFSLNFFWGAWNINHIIKFFIGKKSLGRKKLLEITVSKFNSLFKDSMKHDYQSKVESRSVSEYANDLTKSKNPGSS